MMFIFKCCFQEKTGNTFVESLFSLQNVEGKRFNLVDLKAQSFINRAKSFIRVDMHKAPYHIFPCERKVDI